jgi:enamine deaminase RidA (YjgF/YER057c/UK114 family)
LKHVTNSTDEPTPSSRLRALGIALPEPPAPRFAYIPVVVQGETAYVSGQVARVDGDIVAPGRVGDDVSAEAAAEAARLCLLSALAQLHAAVGIDNVVRVLRLNGYVASAPGFVDQPVVIDGASRLAQEVFGEAGKHARTAIGVYQLPGNASVELDVIAAVRT